MVDMGTVLLTGGSLRCMGGQVEVRSVGPAAAGTGCAPAAAGRSRLDEDLQRVAGVHRAVPVRDTVEVDGAVEDPAGLDAAAEHLGQQLLDVGADRSRAAGEGDVAAEQAA